jgi:hypothetical protein
MNQVYSGSISQLCFDRFIGVDTQPCATMAAAGERFTMPHLRARARGICCLVCLFVGWRASQHTRGAESQA